MIVVYLQQNKKRRRPKGNSVGLKLSAIFFWEKKETPHGGRLCAGGCKERTESVSCSKKEERVAPSAKQLRHDAVWNLLIRTNRANDCYEYTTSRTGAGLVREKDGLVES